MCWKSQGVDYGSFHHFIVYNSQVRKIPWRREWQPALVFLPEEVHRRRSLVSYSPWGNKESDMKYTNTHTHTHTHTYGI